MNDKRNLRVLRPFQSRRILRRGRSHLARFGKNARCARRGRRQEMPHSLTNNVSSQHAASRIHRRRGACMNEQHAATPIRYSGRRSRLGNRPEASPKPSRDFCAIIQRLAPSRRLFRRSAEPLAFSYRILVCVHARGTINGKILESRSRNPAAGFHGSVLLPALPSPPPSPRRPRSCHLATRPFSRSLDLLTLGASARSRSARVPYRPYPRAFY
jgi:hypothetical protein